MGTVEEAFDGKVSNTTIIIIIIILQIIMSTRRGHPQIPRGEVRTGGNKHL
jgi:hypothetical protein